MHSRRLLILALLCFLWSGATGCSTLSTADLHMTMHRYEKAANVYQAYLERHPNSVRAMNGLGSAYLKTGEPDKAVEIFEKALQREPENAFSTLRLGQAYVNTGDIDAAVHVWTDFSYPYRDNMENEVQKLCRALEMYQGTVPMDSVLLQSYGLDKGAFRALEKEDLVRLVNRSIEAVFSEASSCG